MNTTTAIDIASARINGQRLWDSLMELAKIGATPCSRTRKAPVMRRRAGRRRSPAARAGGCDGCAPDDFGRRRDQRLIRAVVREVAGQGCEIRGATNMKRIQKRQNMRVIFLAHRLNPPSTIKVCPVM